MSAICVPALTLIECVANSGCDFWTCCRVIELSSDKSCNRLPPNTTLISCRPRQIPKIGFFWRIASLISATSPRSRSG